MDSTPIRHRMFGLIRTYETALLCAVLSMTVSIAAAQPPLLIGPDSRSAAPPKLTAEMQEDGARITNSGTGPQRSETLDAVRLRPEGRVVFPQPQATFVAIVGAVRRPGVYQATGQSITQVIEGAGGFTPEATSNLRVQRGTRGSQKVFYSPQTQFDILPGDVVIAERDKHGIPAKYTSLVTSPPPSNGVFKGHQSSDQRPHARVNVVVLGVLARPVVLPVPADDANVGGLLKWLNQPVHGTVMLISASGVPQSVNVDQSPLVSLHENCIVHLEPGRVDPTVLPKLPETLTPVPAAAATTSDDVPAAERMRDVERPSGRDEQSPPLLNQPLSATGSNNPRQLTDRRSGPSLAGRPSVDSPGVDDPRNVRRPSMEVAQNSPDIVPQPRDVGPDPESLDDEPSVDGSSMPSVHLRPREGDETGTTTRPRTSGTPDLTSNSGSDRTAPAGETNSGGSALIQNVSLPMMFIGSSGLFMLLLTSLSWLSQKRAAKKAVESVNGKADALSVLVQSSPDVPAVMTANAVSTANTASIDPAKLVASTMAAAVAVRPVPQPAPVAASRSVSTSHLDDLINNQCLVVEEPLAIPQNVRLYGRPAELRHEHIDPAQAIPAPHFDMAKAEPSATSRKKVRIDGLHESKTSDGGKSSESTATGTPHQQGRGLLDRVLTSVQGDVR